MYNTPYTLLLINKKNSEIISYILRYKETVILHKTKNKEV